MNSCRFPLLSYPMKTPATLTTWFGRFFFLLATALAAVAQGNFTIYPAVDSPNSPFTVTVNGSDVPVVAHMDYYYVHFGFSGTATINVAANTTISDVRISPKSLNLAHTMTGTRSLQFNMQQAPDKDSTPRYLMIEMRGLPTLVVLGDPLETNAPSSSGTGIFNVVTNFGANATGASYTQPAIQAAIDAANRYGTSSRPGVVYVPSGTYRVRANLSLKSNVDFYLAPGAVLKADTNRANYTISSGTIDPVLVVQDGAQNVTIRGRGVVDASGVALMNLFSIRPPQFVEQSASHPRRRIIATSQEGTTSNVVIDGIIARDATGWSVEVLRTNGATVQNLKVLNHRDIRWKIQSDGINAVSSSNTLINQCFVITIDDAMCAKARFDSWGTMRNVTFSNNVLWSWSAAVKSGMQHYHPMQNILFENIDIIHARRAVALDTRLGDRNDPPVGNTEFKNIRVEDLNSHWDNSSSPAIEFQLDTGRAENVVISDLTIAEAHRVRLFGSYGANNIKIHNLRMAGRLYTSVRDLGSLYSATVPVTNLTITTGAVSNLLPSVSITEPTSGAIRSVGTNLPITATASDSDGSIAKVSFLYQLNRTGSYILITDDTSSPYTATWSNLPAGNHNIKAIAYDNLSASREAVIPITVNAANLLPTVSITEPTSGAVLTAGSNLPLTAIASDADGSIAKVSFLYQLNGTGSYVLIKDEAIAPYNATWSNLPAGNHNIKAIAYDNLSASREAIIPITVNANHLGAGPHVDSAPLHLWLAAEDLRLSNGATVSTWLDRAGAYTLSGNARYATGFRNGRPGVRFDGVDDTLVTNSLDGTISTGNFSLFIVGSFATTGNDAVSDFLVSSQSPAGANNRMRIVKGRDDGLLDAVVGGGATMANVVAADTAPHVFALISGQSGNSVDLLIDGVVRASSTSGLAPAALNLLALGSYAGASQFFDGTIAEVLLYEGAVSASDAIRIHDYLQNKYALPPAVESAALHLWLAAEDLKLSNGTTVSTWPDRAGAYTLSGTASYEQGFQNGQPAVRFDGVDDTLVTNSLDRTISTGNFSLFIVGSFATTGNDEVSDYLVSAQSPAGADNRMRIFKGRDDGLLDAAAGGGATMANVVAADTAPHVFALISGQSGNSVDFLIDGVVRASSTSGLTPAALELLALGSYRGTGQFFNGRIAEVLLYEGAVNASEAALINDYLETKYAIPPSLD